MDRRRIGELKKYGKILVTGPQRSGSRIAAEIIAYDTGYRYVDEDSFKIHEVNLFEEILRQSNVVIQCPGLCYAIHNYATDDTLIVLVIRPLEDILASEQRIGWKHGPYHEYERYGISRPKAKWYRGRNLKPIAEVKYHFWEKHQRQLVKHYLELEYESLSDHPLWIPQGQRRNFAAKQTKHEYKANFTPAI
jgi:hypothetical protein